MFIKKLYVFLALSVMLTCPLAAQQLQMPGQEEDRPAATVNGETIYMIELNQAAQSQMLIFQMMQVNPQFAQFLQTETGLEFLDEYQRFVLDNLISRTLLTQEAGREGIELSDAEIDEHFNSHIRDIKEQHGLSEEELEEELQQQGIPSMQEYKEVFVEHSNLKEQKLLQEAGVEDADLQEYIRDLRRQADIDIHF